MRTIKQSMFKRGIACLLVVAMLMSMSVVGAFASTTTSTDEAAEKYIVPVKSLTSGAPIPAVQEAFKTAFGENITVSVDKDGNKTALIKTNHMIINIMKDHHANVAKILDADASTTAIEEAVILSTKTEKVTNGFNSDETKDVVVPDEFTIPLNLDADNSQKLSITVDFMNIFLGGGNDYPTTVTLTLDMENAKPDVSALETLIEECKAISSEEYTVSSFKALTNAIEKAEKIAKSPETAKQVNDMVAELQAAKDALKEKKDVIKLEDGTYEIPVALWHATSDKASMAASSLEETAKLVVKDGKLTVYIYTKPMSFGAITASLQEMKVEQADGSWVNAVVESKSADENPTCFSFELDEIQEFITVKVNPHVAMMGNQDLDARLKFDVTSIKAVENNDDLVPEKPPVNDESVPEKPPVADNENGSEVETPESDLPQTGDNNSLSAAVILAILAGAAACFCNYKGRKFN